MRAAQFLVDASARLEFLRSLDLNQVEINSVSFSPGIAGYSSCNLVPLAFVRVARQLGITKLKFSQWGRDQPRFVHNGVEFVCVCTKSQRETIAQEFEMVCTDAHLQEAGF